MQLREFRLATAVKLIVGGTFVLAASAQANEPEPKLQYNTSQSVIRAAQGEQHHVEYHLHADTITGSEWIDIDWDFAEQSFPSQAGGLVEEQSDDLSGETCSTWEKECDGTPQTMSAYGEGHFATSYRIDAEPERMAFLCKSWSDPRHYVNFSYNRGACPNDPGQWPDQLSHGWNDGELEFKIRFTPTHDGLILFENVAGELDYEDVLTGCDPTSPEATVTFS